MTVFTDDLLRAISAWQNGWREDQARRATLASALQAQTAGLETRFLAVSSPCFRKRFVHHGELVALLVKDHLDEGMTSWTTDLRFAERFKGLARDGAISAAIYRHVPLPDEIVANIGELWLDSDFVTAAESLRIRCPDDVTALFHFRDRQAEVVLLAPLRGSEIIALSGASSPFDELCDTAGIPEAERDAAYYKLVEADVYPGGLRYTSGAQNVVARTLQRLQEKIQALSAQK